MILSIFFDTDKEDDNGYVVPVAVAVPVVLVVGAAGFLSMWTN